MAQYKRKWFPIVDRKFQYKYTGYVLIVAIVISTAMGTLLWRAYTELNELTPLAIELGDQVQASSVRDLFRLVLVFLIAEVVLLGGLGLFITHRVAGPVAVIHSMLNTLKEGSYPDFRPLRTGDEFADTFATLRDTVKILKEREARDLEVLDQIIAGQGEAMDAAKALAEEKRARVG